MSGESNLDSLLKKMQPVLSEGRFVFLTSPKKLSTSDVAESILFFKETEGNTIVVKEEKAKELGEKFDYVWGLITLNVHSDLRTVGFLAAITKRLAEESIAVNVVSAYYHDHLFVPWEKRDEAMRILVRITEE